jgi:hypothetical protein
MTLPLGNTTLKVSVEDDLGASGTADFRVEVVFSSSQDVVSAVNNATRAIVDMISAGDGASAVAMIATCAEMLGSGTTGRVGATEARSDLLALAWNSTLDVSAESVPLQAATLELILAVPEETDEATANSAIAFAGSVANSSRALGRISIDARTSLVQALSLTIDARTTEDVYAESISSVVRQVHLLSLPGLAPGEEPLLTQAGSLSISSSEASCMGSCPETAISAPLLAGQYASSNASFYIGPEALAEISGDDEEVGLLAILRKANPYHSSTSAGQITEGLVVYPEIAANVSVTSLSVTANGHEKPVANLTTPLMIKLPIESSQTLLQPAEDKIELTCLPADGGITRVVRCKTTAFNFTYPRDSLGEVRVDVACPVAVPTSPCLCFFEPTSTWGGSGCDAVSAVDDGSSVRCRVSHLTSFVGVVGTSYTSTVVTIQTIGELPGSLDKVWVMSTLLIAIYVASAALVVQDGVTMKRDAQQRTSQMWQSERFHSSLKWVQLHVLDDRDRDTMTTEEARERANIIERARQMALGRRTKRIIKRGLSRSGLRIVSYLSGEKGASAPPLISALSYGKASYLRGAIAAHARVRFSALRVLDVASDEERDGTSFLVSLVTDSLVLDPFVQLCPHPFTGPLLLLDSLTFLFAIVLLRSWRYSDEEEDIYAEWKQASRDGGLFHVFCDSILRTFVETLLLCCVAYFPQFILYRAIQMHESRRSLFVLWEEQLASSGLPRVDTHRTTSVVGIRRALHCATAASRVLGRHYEAKRRSGLRATAGAVVAATRRRGGVVAWASTKEGLAWGQAAVHVERYCACNPSFPTPLLPRLS